MDYIWIWDGFYSAMRSFNTIFNFFGAIVLIVAALYIFNYKYVKMLLVTLGPLGFKRSFIFRTLILCRRNAKHSATINVRKFCEYMILRSQGHIKNDAWWKREHHNFAGFFTDPNVHTYCISNLNEISCDEELEDAIETYFDFLHDNKKRYSLDDDRCCTFELMVTIDYGLLSTNYLISGLLKTYKDDWNVLINKYISAVNEDRGDTLFSAKLSNVFIWLLWGPSYQLVEEQRKGIYKITQYSFGDENNSFYLMIPTSDKCSQSDQLWKEVSSTPNGFVCGMTCKLHSANEYIKKNRESFTSCTSYYLDKIAQGNTIILEARQAHERKGGDIEKQYYCTAYVWIIFYAKNSDNDSFDPRDTVAFFEHTNQADKSSYDICIKALFAKTFAFFDNVFSDNKHDRSYQYLLSMNEEIHLEFMRLYIEKTTGNDELAEKYKAKLTYGVMHDISYSSTIFKELDKYFSAHIKRYELVEVESGDLESLAYFGEYYTSIHYKASSGKGRKSLDHLLNVLEKNKDMHPIYHVLLTRENEVVGAAICDYKANKNHMILKSFYIKRSYLQSDPNIQKEVNELLKDTLKTKGYRLIADEIDDNAS